MTLEQWFLVGGEVTLFGLYVWARINFWGRMATVWWLLGAISMAAIVLLHEQLPPVVRWSLVAVVLVVTLGLFAMSTGNGGTGGDDDL